jgi:hypothetical protein
VGKRRWRARTPRPVGTSVAHGEREASWSAERQFRFGLSRFLKHRADIGRTANEAVAVNLAAVRCSVAEPDYGYGDPLGSSFTPQCKNSRAINIMAPTSKNGAHQCIGMKNKECRD